MYQWYPGHMAKTKRLIEENLKIVDIVYELIDARIPKSSRNPLIDELVKNKKRIILLNKADLSDSAVNKMWNEYFKKLGIASLNINSLNSSSIKEIYELTLKECSNIIDRKRQKGIKAKLRAMIVGIPNVGKSTLINSLSKTKSAKTGNKPGVTKAKQWIRTPYFDLLDTPGILWPKFEDEHVGIMLALTAAIKDELLNHEELAFSLLKILKQEYPELLMQRYKIQYIDIDLYDLLREIGKMRGCLSSGGHIDTERTSKIIVEDFRTGKLGKISLERPD
ncbi:ribosome biogenesis GTPase YlqF [Thermoanaerobacterium thermosaccharolyticum]|uniref:Ribosome biogenesis GTPase A n=2 Tax=Thermoanaerobacterium thermosaccharolyticum TaxID=1517 RepID=A0A223I2K0_THETR|nr:ribosome biogenesis GTPase YlqF [Thermoanaerobacterium thermosaccharolyticum]AGB19075.1 ribosome biogenesis GTP-binding protein YlqF [Thermoanaerobacterium thermosaccharolyticum M0795]AST58976.1 ribosome biogenesis GTP-binding protein [Thermoanaerobacterium thermosaccharolyticum]KAA5807789.1 ribosome biogenesis GTPase YlqF [Thermoanaerobacterium thermosaccharolyticum]